MMQSRAAGEPELRLGVAGIDKAHGAGSRSRPAPPATGRTQASRASRCDETHVRLIHHAERARHNNDAPLLDERS